MRKQKQTTLTISNLTPLSKRDQVQKVREIPLNTGEQNDGKENEAHNEKRAVSSAN